MLKIVEKSKVPDMVDVLLDAIIRKTEQSITPDYPKQMATLGVKYIVASRPERDRTNLRDVRFRFDILNYTQSCFLKLTPRQITQMFPIEKQYDGKRWNCKDYFTTAAYLKTLNMDEPVADGKKLLEFFWEYQNMELENFWIEIFSNMDDMAHLQGEAGPLDKMIDNLGLETYTMHQDEQTGKEFMLSSKTGKTVPISTKPHLTLLQ